MSIMITGATSGIGKALALSYAKAGHKVIACGRSQQKLDELTQLHLNISTLCFDLTQFDSYPPLPNGIGKLDLLILNAGDCEYIDDPINFDGKLFERVININLISIGYALDVWLKSLRSGGRLVLISSSAQLLALPRAEAYGASKAALSYLAQTLSIDLTKDGIAVTCVHPGFVDTQLTSRNTFAMPMIVSSEQAAQKIIQGIAKGKRDISFPGVFIFLMKCLSWLPFSLWRRLAIRMN
ncbi:SDR family NAD(P)-dependent oxidoreductase [Shewanella mesophila]|uniref:SDR family NAD(P)-dependent oxidoreductase n=1 Tax=Shewanella mesophila TaxID=2864208 RepID=UPI001C65F566|nr:SDR family NAD(P)-dependent oxidoreductase [Shewanella mesophila]QYJ84931.1 SDR family NAD(P)-dependent oxidoreductase [Shewanella mesophila]